jgi:hypothetical protein
MHDLSNIRGQEFSNHPPRWGTVVFSMIGMLGLLIGVGSCAPSSDAPRTPAVVRSTPLSPAEPAPLQLPSIAGMKIEPFEIAGGAPSNAVSLHAAKNEWASFTLRLTGLPAATVMQNLSLHFSTFKAKSPTAAPSAAIAPANIAVYQILPMPVDANRAGYVRHTGASVGTRELLRALLPIPTDNGTIQLGALRDPHSSTDPKSHAGGNGGTDDASAPVVLWVDLHIPFDAAAGDFTTAGDVVISGSPKPALSVPIALTVYDFALPTERHLQMVSRIDWDSLQRLYPDRMEAVSPQLVDRRDDRYAPLVKTLDDLVALAQANRCTAVVPRLQPSVKWLAGQPPQADWDGFDSMVAPWLSGDAFTDKTPLGYWPVPAIDFLDNFDPDSQRQYWREAAVHFSVKNWLDRSSASIENPTKDVPTSALADRLSVEAARVLSSHSLLQATVPLEDDQLRLVDPAHLDYIEPQTRNRLFTAAAGLVSRAVARSAHPAGTDSPTRHWLRTDMPGLVPYAGAGGDECDVRLWAWLAYLRRAELILWDNALPRQDDPATPEDPNELIWFYPGQWFGVAEPVPSIQLKWLRRAQQDYEYLALATRRGQTLDAVTMARLMTKPVQVAPDQAPDPSYALLCGTIDPTTWDEAQALLARTILLREPGKKVDESKERALNLDLIGWQAPKERQFLLARSCQWTLDPNRPNWLNATLGLDVYNASDRPADSKADRDRVGWAAASLGWQFKPAPEPVEELPTYRIKRFDLTGRFDLSSLTLGSGSSVSNQPITAVFIDGYTNRASTAEAVIPIAASDRRKQGLKFDGLLDDWFDADLVQNGPMIKLLDRPSLQRQKLQRATVPARIYTSWADERFYVAFKLTGIATSDIHFSRNFVEYQNRRAWGEDLCEVLVQPIYADSSVGPSLHIVCKPAVQWTERKDNPAAGDEGWAPFEGASVIYAATVDHGDWNGELAIPWKAMTTDPAKGLPKLLRFNFTQHRTSTGETASWAGPVDYGRDEALTGLLYLRDPNVPGMGEAHSMMRN